MCKFKVLRVEPTELPRNVIFYMGLQKITLDEFSVYVDIADETIYAKKTVPEKDIQQFIEVVNFPYSYVMDEEKGKGEFLNYVYTKYGCLTFLMLVKSHQARRKNARESLALEKITELANVLEKTSDEVPVDEALLYAAYKVGRKTDKRTADNFIDYSTKYVFALGYLIGNKTLQANLIGGAV